MSLGSNKSTTLDFERVAIVVGATGLIGSHLVPVLTQSHVFTKVFTLSRRPMNEIIGAQNKMVSFDSATDLAAAMSSGTDLFFCFGTTLKAAGSKEAFTEIEWNTSRRILDAAKLAGIKNVVLISSVGANSNSSLLYPKIKGLIEVHLKKLDFDKSIVLRPSLLLGERKEFRMGESIAQKLSGGLSYLMMGPLLEYRAIQAELVARRMFEFSNSKLHGFHIFKNTDLHKGWKEIKK